MTIPARSFWNRSGRRRSDTSDLRVYAKIRALCDERDMLMMVDEVQTESVAAGHCLPMNNLELNPMCALAKGLGGGFPIGAMLAKDKAAAAFHPGDHASTFGGNPMASTAGLAVLEKLRRRNLTENAWTVGRISTVKRKLWPQNIRLILRGTGTWANAGDCRQQSR
ncbi:MAG: aminotransferase class III-fold pyridoxal phosphate-dependent enzyme [Clostridia bacterium]